MTDTGVQVFDLIVGIHQMLNVNIKNQSVLLFFFLFLFLITWIWQGLTPTIILVRVSMGLSFHDEKTMADATMMRLYPPETESTVVIIGNGQRKIRVYHDDNFNDDIEMSEKSVDGSLL